VVGVFRLGRVGTGSLGVAGAEIDGCGAVEGAILGVVVGVGGATSQALGNWGRCGGGGVDPTVGADEGCHKPRSP